MIRKLQHARCHTLLQLNSPSKYWLKDIQGLNIMSPFDGIKLPTAYRDISKHFITEYFVYYLDFKKDCDD